MTFINYTGQSYKLQDQESVLDCLLRHGVNYPHSCQTGVCQSCLSRGVEGEIDQSWQKGLKDSLIAKNYFLPCIAHPLADLSLNDPGEDDVETSASISKITMLNDDVIQVRLDTDNPDNWVAGQYINLVNPDGVIRPYSIANVPRFDGDIELHVKSYHDGKMSSWLVNQAFIGQTVAIRGPVGDCFYQGPQKADYPIILAGTGTGLAPLVGIVKDALNQGHQGQIVLIHGALKADDLYGDQQLRDLDKSYEHFSYMASLYDQQPVEKVLMKVLPQHVNAKLYVCGPEETTKKLKTMAFLTGLPSTNIYSDAFVSM